MTESRGVRWRPGMAIRTLAFVGVTALVAVVAAGCSRTATPGSPGYGGQSGQGGYGGTPTVRESCDGANLAGNSCDSLGYFGGALGCTTTTCAFDVDGCETCAPASAPVTSCGLAPVPAISGSMETV